MQVTLAGFNVDTEVLSGSASLAATPEVISAAYARISRDPRPVGELRAASILDLKEARKSNRNIVFDMGHHSVAEHAVFNFDVVGISRLVIEYLEHHRLCSYTEKSQRYVALGKDFVVPREVVGRGCHAPFMQLLGDSHRLYEKFYPILLKYFQEQKSDAPLKLQEGWAKEDARYPSLLATSGQLGLTASARNLELIIQRCASSSLDEVRDLGNQLHECVKAVAPSLFRHVSAQRYIAERVTETQRFMTQLLEGWNGVAAQAENISNVLLVGHTPDADVRLCESLVHSAFKDASHGWSTAVVAGMGAVEKQQLVLTALRHLEFYDAVPREFEHINFTFELRVSASCFAQLKRHRMMTQTPQPYDTALTPTVPLSIEEMGLADEYLEHCRNAVELYAQMEADHGEACAEYVLTNGHKRRVLATLNLREFYHFARMRQDAHAQWDIRNIANRMMTTALAVAPIGMSLVCGKDNFVKQVSWAYDEEWAKTKQAP